MVRRLLREAVEEERLLTNTGEIDIDHSIQAGMDTAIFTGMEAVNALINPGSDNNMKDLATFIFGSDKEQKNAQSTTYTTLV